jgi:hypothetical protein
MQTESKAKFLLCLSTKIWRNIRGTEEGWQSREEETFGSINLNLVTIKDFNPENKRQI